MLSDKGLPRSKMKALEWSQHYTLNFKMLNGQLIPVSFRIWSKLELIQAFMIVLVICKNEDNPIKNEGARVSTTFLPL